MSQMTYLMQKFPGNLKYYSIIHSSILLLHETEWSSFSSFYHYFDSCLILCTQLLNLQKARSE